MSARDEHGSLSADLLIPAVPSFLCGASRRRSIGDARSASAFRAPRRSTKRRPAGIVGIDEFIYSALDVEPPSQVDDDVTESFNKGSQA
jgi:hypothetical protein